MTYSEKLKDPRWQRKRLEILSRDEFTCRSCGDKESTLHVHHIKYDKEIWGGNDKDKVTLCESCHESAEMSKAMLQELNREVGIQAMHDITSALHMAYLTLRGIGGVLSTDALISRTHRYLMLSAIRRTGTDSPDALDIAMSFGDFELQKKSKK